MRSGPLAAIKSLSSTPKGKPMLKSIPHMKEKKRKNGASARVSRTRTMVVDFSKVKADLFSDTSGQVSIEQVLVNQRHLIDKILARYSAEFTVYREIIQNANDAGAKEVEISFSSTCTKQVKGGKVMIESIQVRNNGRPFTEEDWRRLKSIAEGNPDEQKIGFFGVGFYSLFSICEEPLVISGDRCLGFYWRGDQLYTRSGPVSVEESKNETCICLQLREPLECPDLDHFAQFLGKAVLFTVNLQRACFSLDGQLQFAVEKGSEPESVDEYKAVASSILKSSSTGLFTLKSLQPLLLNVNIDKRFQSPEPSTTDSSSSTTSFFSGLWRLAQAHLTEKGRKESALEEQLRQPGKYALKLKYLRGMAAVSVPARFAAEMERTTKKKPFSQVYIDMIWSDVGSSEDDGNEDGKRNVGSSTGVTDNPSNSPSNLTSNHVNKHPILKHLLPLERGKVYIGFETHQSTGLGLHLAAPFIPTVERESIDFVDGCLRQWNLELLQVAGKMGRLIYERELKQATNTEALKTLLKTFNFTDSTPAPHVCVALFKEFTDQSAEIKLPAQNGKLVPISQLRFIPAEMQPFMKNCPQVPAELEQACSLFLQRLQNHNSSNQKRSLPTATHSDIIQFELKQRQLSTEEVIALIKWWSKNAPASADLNREFSSALKIVHPHNQAVLSLAQFSLLPSEQLIALHTAEPDWLPFWPIDCVPVQVAEEVGDVLRGLETFGVAGWLEGLAKSSAAKEAIQSDRDRAERLLLFCSKQWDHATEVDQGRIASVLASFACIPVASGALKVPRLCFFDDVAQEGLLPVDSVLACSSDLRRSRLNVRMLKAVGVQSHLPLESVLQSSSAASLSTVQYLFKHREELSRSELERVRNAAIFPSSDGGLVRLSALFAPSAVSKQLGLPSLAWTDPLPREGSDLARFLEQLGFNYTIPWRLVLGGVKECAGESEKMMVLFRYFFEHYAEYESFRPDEVDFPFLPVQSSDEKEQKQLLLLPSQVFLNEEVELLGFYLLAGDLKKWALQLGVSERPNSALLTQQICKSRLSIDEAKKLFAYLSRVSFGAAEVAALSQAPFIPINREGVLYKAPKQVFFASTSTSSADSQHQGFAELFDQVDFGAAGNSFLRTAGVQDEPTIEHLVTLLCAGKGAEGIFETLGAVRYGRMMEKLGKGWSEFQRKNSSLAKAFASAPVFLASVKAETHNEAADAAEEEDEQKSIQFRLFKASEAFLIDDTISQQIFNLPAVPSQLNDFYAQLGCKWISSVVRTEWKRTGKPDAAGALAREVQKIINDRLGLVCSSLENTNRRGRKKLTAAKFYQLDAIKIARFCLSLKQENLQPVSAYTDGQNIYLALGRDGQFDYFDLAGVVVEMLCEQKGKLQDALLVATLLTTPLASLRAKGFKVAEEAVIDAEAEIATKSKDERGKEQAVERVKPSLPSLPADSSMPMEKSNSLKPPMSHSERKLPPLPIEHERISAPTPSKPLSPIIPDEKEKLIESESTRPESPDAIKSFFGMLKQSTESLISKLSSSNTPSPVHQEPSTAGQARDEETLQQALRRGINSLRKHRANDLDATINEADRAEPAIPPPPNRKQASDFCCENARLKFYAVLGGEEVRFYFPNGMDDASCVTKFNQFNAALISFYGLIVEELGRGVFGVSSMQSLCLFYDPDSSAIAFNHSQSLFFNFAYFLSNRHHQTPTALKVRSFWFVTFCHELAHNFISAHNAEHEFYMSCFLETYLPVFFTKIQQ